LNGIIKNAKCQMMLCVDSCHSGSQCSLEYSINYNGGALTKTVNNSKLIADTNIVMISGCQDSQTCADAYDNMAREGVGAFTQTLLETLRQNDHNIALVPLYAKLCANLKTEGFSQIPVLSSSAPSPVFQFERTNPAQYSSLVGSNTNSIKNMVLSNKTLTTSPATKPLRKLMAKLTYMGNN